MTGTQYDPDATPHAPVGPPTGLENSLASLSLSGGSSTTAALRGQGPAPGRSDNNTITEARGPGVTEYHTTERLGRVQSVFGRGPENRLRFKGTPGAEEGAKEALDPSPFAIPPNDFYQADTAQDTRSGGIRESSSRSERCVI